MAEARRLVPVVVKEGEPPIWVEESVDPLPEKPRADWIMASPDDDLSRPHSLDQALDRIRPLVDVLFEKISSVAVPPNEVELNLALKLSGKVGIFVAESTGEASVTFKLKWVRQAADGQRG